MIKLFGDLGKDTQVYVFRLIDHLPNNIRIVLFNKLKSYQEKNKKNNKHNLSSLTTFDTSYTISSTISSSNNYTINSNLELATQSVVAIQRAAKCFIARKIFRDKKERYNKSKQLILLTEKKDKGFLFLAQDILRNTM